LGRAAGRRSRSLAGSGRAAPDATDTMTLDQIERWIGDHIKPKR
jgi:hypothetical protein